MDHHRPLAIGANPCLLRLGQQGFGGAQVEIAAQRIAATAARKARLILARGHKPVRNGRLQARAPQVQIGLRHRARQHDTRGGKVKTRAIRLRPCGIDQRLLPPRHVKRP
jgi:hypothetical protein